MRVTGIRPVLRERLKPDGGVTLRTVPRERQAGGLPGSVCVARLRPGGGPGARPYGARCWANQSRAGPLAASKPFM
jgi:hypothetical protein